MKFEDYSELAPGIPCLVLLFSLAVLVFILWMESSYTISLSISLLILLLVSEVIFVILLRCNQKGKESWLEHTLCLKIGALFVGPWICIVFMLLYAGIIVLIKTWPAILIVLGWIGVVILGIFVFILINVGIAMLIGKRKPKKKNKK